MLIFSDGLPQKGSIIDAITIIKQKLIIDFIIVQSSPWQSGENFF